MKKQALVIILFLLIIAVKANGQCSSGDITGSNNVCVGNTITLTPAPSGTSPFTFTWVSSNPAIATVSSAGDVTGVSAGTTDITYYFTDSNGTPCTSAPSNPFTVTVNTVPPAAGVIAGSSSICPDEQNVSYNVPAISGAAEYIWSFTGSGESYSGNTNPVLIDFTSATAGDLTVTGRNSCGDGTSSATFPISINPLPDAAGSISGSATVCQGQNMVSYSVGTISNADSYEWAYSGDGATLSIADETVTINFGTGATSGNLTVNGNNTCGDGPGSSLAITVNPLPSGTGIISGTSTLCQGTENVTYTVAGITNAASYLWNYTGTGATFSSTTNSVTVDFDSGATSGNLTVYGINGCGDGSTFTLWITLNPLPTLSGVSMTTACDGSGGDILLTGLLSSSSFTINYGFPGHTGQTADISTGLGITQQSFTTVPLDEGDDDGETLTINSITVTSPTPSCSKTFTIDNTVTLQVDEPPRMTSVSQQNSVCAGSPAIFEISGLIGGSTSTIYYTVDGGPEQSVSGIVATGGGNATFTSVALSSANNGKRLYVTRIRKTFPSPVCESTITGEYAVMEVSSVSPSITGLNSVCQGVAGNYSTNISGGGTTYNWNIVSGTATINSGEFSQTANVTWTTNGTIEVVCVKGGCTGTATLNVNVNTAPSPTITGSSTVYPGIPITYNTTPGMLSYDWDIIGGSPASGDGSSLQVTWNSGTSPHSVSLSYKSIAGCQSSAANLNVLVRPSVTGVHIDYPDGDPKIGGRFSVDYTYVDGSTGSDASTYVWKRGPTVVSMAKVYTAVEADFNQVLSCEVTPVSSIGALSGTPVTVMSLPVEDLTHAGVVPDAKEVCIDGTRTTGSTLRGMYSYDFPYKSEGVSTFRWLKRDTLPAGSEIEIGTGFEYTLTAADIADDKEIYFEVTPVSSNYHPIAGVPKKSKPLAKIMGLDQQYVVTAAPVIMSSNVPGGSFSGPGVYGNIFIPDSTGSGTFEINYFKFYEYSDHTCSQRSPQSVLVEESSYTFDPPIQARYCSYDAPFTVTVTSIPPLPPGPPPVYSESDRVIYCLNKDGINDMSGITPVGLHSITINPLLMSAGKHTLVYQFVQVIVLPPPFSFTFFLQYRVRKEFVIERVRKDTKFIGLNDKYCKNAADQYISIEGVNPLEGTGIWEYTPVGGDDLLIDEVVNSAVFRPNKGTVGGTYHIRYHYQAPLGCESNQLDQAVTIYDLPDAGFSIAGTYNVEGIPDLLEPDVDPGSGTYIFTGKGVSRDYFIPSLAAEGEILPADIGVTYTITDVNGCTNSSTEHTWVREAIGTISGINPVVCYDNVDIAINAAGVPVNGVDGIVVYKGFSNLKNTLTPVLGATTALYSVPDAGKGTDRIDFEYLWDDVKYVISKQILIDSLGKVEIYNLHQDTIICKDAAPFALEVSKTGGFFTGPVDLAGNLVPSLGTAPDVVTYTHVNPDTKCSIDTSYNINVYDAPNVDFIPYDVCIIDDTDTLRFINNTTSADPVVAWEWKFYDEGVITPSSLEDARYLYLRGGLQKVSLKATTDKGCFVEREKTFDIARRPVADFYWKKDCFHPGELLQLFDATSFTTPPKSWSWKINGSPSGTSNNTTWLKTDTGFLHVEYIVRTDYTDCHDTVIKDVYIRPSITIGADGYFEDFEAGKRGWIVGDTSTIWSFGTPSGIRIQEAASGQKAWFTANARDGSSAIESPCFDFTGMTRPLVKTKLQRDLDKDRDGAVLQYKVGDDPAWKLLGTIDDGIDWYNSAVISGRPGGSPVGWTTAGSSDEQYYDAIHTLDELKGKKDVKFRMIYGAAGVFSEHDGLAFDNVFIGERSRQVLVEHFMSYGNTESMIYKALIDTVAEHREGDVINIQYHTNLSGTDSLYMFNPGEINARILFYGLTRVPYTFVDGGTGSEIDKTFNMLYDYKSNPVDSNEITKRTLVNASFKLHIDPVISGRVLSVGGYIKALENISAGNLTLFLAVTEKKTQVDYSGAPAGMKFLNVFRKFIPDASGTILKSNWNAGDSVVIPEKAWTIDRVLNSSDIEIIAFLQSAGSKDVYQAFSVVRPDILVGIENPFGREGRFSIYPNPASEIFTISFEGPLRNEAKIRIYNFSGEIVREYRAGAGTTEYVIEDPGLKGGIYLVRISSGNFDMGFKKLIITED